VRLRLILAAAAAAVLAGGVAVAVVLVTAGEAHSMTKAQYVARVNEICRVYNARLARVPAPVAVGNPQAVAQSIAAALPLVIERADKVRAVDAPPELETQVRAMFALSDRALSDLNDAYALSRANRLLDGMKALGRFLAVSDRAKQIARRIGLSC
jgi:hypothetical protein